MKTMLTLCSFLSLFLRKVTSHKYNAEINSPADSVREAAVYMQRANKVLVLREFHLSYKLVLLN